MTEEHSEIKENDPKEEHSKTEENASMEVHPEAGEIPAADGRKSMDREHLMAAAEAVLFAVGRAVSSEELAKALGVSLSDVRRLMEGFAQVWNSEVRGTEIAHLEDSWQMRTRKDYYPQLITLELNPQKPRLTDALLETLSIIAYRQPVTKAEIERIRGVNSDRAVNRLIEYHLVNELGRAKAPGRPILFGTTEEFLRAFGLSSADALPAVPKNKEDQFREEAEEEATVGV